MYSFNTTMNVKIYKGDLEACRVCLATDIKLISLQDNHLKHIYSEFSGMPMTVTDSLPQHICTFCCALLKKSFKFRQKCKDTNNMLICHLLQMQALTTSFIDTLDRSYLRIPLTVTDPLVCNCIPEPDVTCIENEVTVIENAMPAETITISDDEIDEPHNFDDFDNNSNQDSDAGLEINMSVSENKESIILEEIPEVAAYVEQYTVDDEKQEFNDNLNTAEIELSNDDERIEEFKHTYCNKAMHSDKESFYLYILEKYLKKCKTVTYADLLMAKNDLHVNTTGTPALICTDNCDIEYSKDDKKNITELCHSNLNMNQRRLYEFIDSRYVNGDTSTVKQKKIKDIDKMKIKKRRRTHNGITKDSLAKISKKYNVDVKLLLKEEKMQDLLDRKETDKYKNAKYKCELCYTGYKYENTFQNHKAIHDPSAGAYECELCHVRFKTSHRYRCHMARTHTYKFICRECGRVTRESVGVREHHRTHSGLKYTCEHCNQTFNTYSARINHIGIHHGSVSCDVCHKKFANVPGLIIHKTRAHKELFKCAMCSVLFHNGNALRRHQELTLEGCGAHITPCTQCGESFIDEESLANHMDRHRRTRLGVYEPRKRRKRICLQPKSNEPLPKLMCEICAKTFQGRTALNYHQSSQHSDERPLPCDVCDKRFKNKFQLKMHKASHTDERPFQCAHCLKAFRIKRQLINHMRVHSDERPFPCQICQKRFKARDTVQFHVRTVHEGRPTKKRIRKRNKQL